MNQNYEHPVLKQRVDELLARIGPQMVRGILLVSPLVPHTKNVVTTAQMTNACLVFVGDWRACSKEYGSPTQRNTAPIDWKVPAGVPALDANPTD